MIRLQIKYTYIHVARKLFAFGELHNFFLIGHTYDILQN